MSDDREEFERDRLAQDGEGERPLLRSVFHETLEELEAASEPAAPPCPRFGERVRAHFAGPATTDLRREDHEALAAEIDADRDHLQAGLDSWKESAETWYAKAIRRLEPEDLRRRIEEAVGRLAFRSYEGSPCIVYQADVLAALAEIFGDRPAESPSEPFVPDQWVRDIVKGCGGFHDFERYELPVWDDRDEALASFVLRCLANPECEGSAGALAAIRAHRGDR